MMPLNPKLGLILVGASLLSSLLWGALGYAIQVLPMEQEFDPQKTKNLDIVINNTNGAERVVEITLYARSQDEKGKEQRVPSKDFFIIPRQVKLLAGQHQTIKLIWQGSRELLKEQAYRLIVEQLPIDLPQPPEPIAPTKKTEVDDESYDIEVPVKEMTEKLENSDKLEGSGKPVKSEKSVATVATEKMEKVRSSKNQIEFLYKFVASIYARPSSAAAKIEFELGSVDEKKQHLKLVVVNSGLAHQLLSRGQLVLESAQAPVHKISLAELPSLYNLNLMAGSRVNIQIPWKEKLPPTKVIFEEKGN